MGLVNTGHYRAKRTTRQIELELPMVIRSLHATLTRIRWLAKTASPGGGLTRLLSSHASTIDDSETISLRFSGHRNGLREILRKSGPRRSVSSLLQDWVDSGHLVTLSELRFISKGLIRSERYDLALQIMNWIEARKGVQLSAYDHALKLEFLIKIHGLKNAEDYFEELNKNASLKAAKAAYLPLLRAYVKKRMVKEAETLMKKLNELGFLVTPHPFNEMMKLYEATSQYEKVPLVILQMKQNKIPRNILSYNLWMNACCQVSGIVAVETVYKELLGDKSIEPGWSSLCTLANAYIKANLDEKANLVLENAEKKLNNSNRLGYFFLITLYASLGNKKGVLRLWEASKSVCGRITCANYICLMSSLIKIGDLSEAERVFNEWEAKSSNYDVRVSNVLLGAYARKGKMQKAESFHSHVLKRGGKPNYKTWEILMEGWVKSQNMEKAIDAMQKAFELMKDCHWRPSQNILVAIAEYFEKEEKLEEAVAFVRDLHGLGLASLLFYRLLLRMHARAQRPAFEIHEMMKLDKIQTGNENQ